MRRIRITEKSSLAELLASVPVETLRRVLKGLPDELIERLLHDWWNIYARPSQLPPLEDWRTWLLLAGRGFGKTRTGAEWVRAQAESGRCRRLALVAPTAADARDVMVEGESGILGISSPDLRPKYEPSRRRLTWINGAIATTYSADEPARLRGPQHDGAWADELAVWRYPEAWHMLMLGLRLGKDPRVVVTTTPKPIRLIKELIASPTTAVTRGATYENTANLAPAFIQEIARRYEGTRMGRQELYAELLEDAEGALWTRDLLEAARVTSYPALIRTVVAVDPAAGSGEESAETGIIVAALGEDERAYVLDDRSLRASPDTWARAAVAAYHSRSADRLIAEANYGGEMVEHTVRTVDKDVAFSAVHATRGKIIRAEPVAALYEQGRVRHVGFFPELEEQLCTWTPGADSPDRLDALVWAITELMLGRKDPNIRTFESWKV